MSDDLTNNKSALRRHLRQVLADMNDQTRQDKSQAACQFLVKTDEFRSARVIMLYLSMPTELDTSPLALAAWQTEKTVVVPKVSWDQRRMLPVEITSLQSGITVSAPGVREPTSGQPMPVNMIDLVIVPGLCIAVSGHRIGRGMGFYDRFLSQSDFIGLSCGLSFEEQIVTSLPTLDHDVALGMLVTDQGIRRFASNRIS
jgi:5-formyltetrahydrofolate cyclo-ligase